jgi:hypothetical protein
VATASTRTPSARAGDVARGVADHDRAVTGVRRAGCPGATPGHLGQARAVLGVRAEAALPAGEEPTEARRAQLQPRASQLLVAAQALQRERLFKALPERRRGAGVRALELGGQTFEALDGIA